MEFRVLGPLEVVGAGPASTPPGAKERAILARLLLDAGRPVATEQLLEAAWPDAPQARSMPSLRVRLANLRAFLEPDRPPRRRSALLVRDAAGYRLATPPEQVDAVRLERLVDEAARLPAEQALGRYEAALALWRGPPFADLRYASFVQPEIRRLEALRARAVLGRAQALVALSRHDEALPLLEGLVADEPLHEEVVRALAVVLYRTGRQVDALEALRALAGRLDALGLQPSAETRELERGVLLHDDRLAPPTAAPGAGVDATRGAPPPRELPPPLARATPPVGRDEPLARLLGVWQEAGAGTSRLLVVAGEPGIGKTTLAAALARRAHDDGATVLYGRADHDLAVPYGPWVEALERHLACLAAGDRARLLAARDGALGRLLPGPGTPTEAGPTARHVAFEAVREVLEHAARPAGAVVVLDDLHWADADSLQLLRHLARRADRVRLVIVACVREPELTPTARSTLGELARDAPLVRVPLDGLDEAAVARLVGERTGTADAALARTLAARSAGNPFFLDELLRDRQERGAAAAGPPPGVRGVVEQRVGRLGPGTREALVIAAVAGFAFDAVLVAAVGGQRVEDTLEALDRAVGAGLVRVGDRVGTYVFAHALVVETLVAALPPSRLARLHLRLADELERRSDGGGRAGRLAMHLRAAAPLVTAERRIRWERAAAREAAAALAFDDAAAHLREALAALAGAPTEREQRGDLLIALGDAYERGGRRPEARAAFAVAAEAARALGDARLLARAALGHGGLTVTVRDPDDGVIDLLEEALGVVPPDEPEIAARLRARLAVELYYPAPRRARELGALAVAEARAAGGPAVVAAALNAQRVALWDPRHLPERLAAATEMVAAARAARDREAELQGRNWRVVDLLELGRTSEVASEVDAYERLAGPSGLPHFRWYVPLWRACLAALAGRWQEAARLRAEAAAIGREADDPNAALLVRVQLATALVEQGRWTEVDHAFIEERSASPSSGPAWRVAVAGHHALRGDLDAARAVAAELARDDCAALKMDANWHAACELAVVASLLGDRTMAAALHRLLAPHAGLYPVIARAAACYGSCEYFLALLAATLDRVEEAEARLRRAVQANDRIGAAPRAAMAAARLGDVLARRGETRRAADVLADARRRAVAVDMGLLVAEVDAAARALRGRT